MEMPLQPGSHTDPVLALVIFFGIYASLPSPGMPQGCPTASELVYK